MKIKLVLLVIAILLMALLFSGCFITRSERLRENERLNDIVNQLDEDMDRLNDHISRLKEDVEVYKSNLKECLEKAKEDKHEDDEAQDQVIMPSERTFEPDTMTLISTYSYDMNKDGSDDEINLYTSSLKDDSGNIMWDDGQYFILEVVSEGMSYELFNEYVQIGRVYFAVNDSDHTGIVLTVSTYSGFRFEYFSYNPEEDGFEKEVIYSSDDLNIMYTSMPWD